MTDNPHVLNAVEAEYLHTVRAIADLRSEVETAEKLLAAKRVDLESLLAKRKALAEFLGYDE